MSSWFKNRNIDDKILRSSLDSSTERTSDAISSDESDDISQTVCSVNTSGSSKNDRDCNNNQKQYRPRTLEVLDGGNDKNAKTEVLNRNFELPAIEELTINSKFELEILPDLQNLTLNSDCESLDKIQDLSLSDQKPLAGVVTSVAKVIGLIIVKPSKPHDVLLYIGSPVFLRNSNLSPVSEDVKLGWISDVFGPAHEPYYCVKPSGNYIDLVNFGSEVFYSPDHPRTAFIRLELAENNRYTVMFSSTCSLLDHRKFSGLTRDDSPNRKMYRRRRRRNSNSSYRKSVAYRNKYRNDQCSFDAIDRRPKHTYFDY